MSDVTSAKPKILRQISMMNSSNPQVAVLRLQTAEGEEFYAIARSELSKFGELLTKNAVQPQS